MFLKSLTIKGFKSFADSTVMALEPGVTVVVGPNGSGKSNVVDAIAWVLGAQAPKSVRSQKMDDVIFAGTEKRSALGRAEVSLTLDNSSGLLPIDFNEVTLTRVLFRSGESEYAINGVTCRLLDLQELLSDAGVGRQQHVIVSQGQIDAVLNARPEDRRGIIEEAAGVLKYRKRKEKAERRLDATEANLLRLQDLLREVRRQLRPLERQAEAARRHAEITDELTSLRVYVAGREIAALRAKLTTIAADRDAASTSERDTKAALASLDTEIVDAEAALAAQGESDVGDRLRRVEQLRERARGLAGIVAERRRSIERDRGQLLDAGVVANLEGDLTRLRTELAEVVVGLEAIEPDTIALDDDEAELRADRERMATLFATESDGSQAASAAAEVRGELRSVRTSVEQLESAHRSATGRLDAVKERIAEFDEQTTGLRAECERSETDEAALVEQLEAAEAAQSAAVSAFEAARSAHTEAVERASRAEARAEALQQALDAVRARAGADRLADVDGVLGTLLDVVDVDERWMPAVEAALADALTSIVVDGDDAALRALEALRESGTSGAVLPTRRSGRRSVEFDRGVALRDQVESTADGVDGILDALLADVVCVPTFESGVDAALANPELTVVTEAGDRFGRSGWRVGAAAGGATAAALTEAESAAEAAAAERDRAAEELRSADHDRERTTAAVTARSRDLDQHDARFSAASERLARVLEQRRDAQTELNALEANLAEINERWERDRARLTELDELMPALDADEQAEAEAARRRGEARAEFENRAAVIASRRRELEVRGAGLHERRQFLERRIAETEQRLTADAEARERAAEQREQLERGLVALDRLAELLTHLDASVQAEWDQLDERRRRQSDEVRGLTGRLEDARRRRTDAERVLDEARQRLQKCEIDAAEARLRLESAIETLRRDLDVEPEAAEAAPMPEVPEGATPAGRVRELDRELRLLGPINPLALEEFNELQQRNEFLEAQLEDVRSTRRDLHRVIKAVDAEIQNVFVGAFADVSTNFTQLFGTLFPGGSGHLKLVNPDDLLNTGIEVEAKPSGKNVKKLSLLSGGERSLTALAFLFAVFRSRPSPFYVMDEVEAALDDVNLHRFLGLVDEFRKDAQLVIVSHQKRTMEAGDSLLGVSMQPGGSSKVVTERAATATAR